MNKRPLCQILLVLMIGLGLCKCVGISWWKSPDTKPFLCAKAEQCVSVTGIVYAQEEKVFQYQTYTYLYLEQTNLLIESKKYPIRKIKCTLEEPIENLLDCEITLSGILSLPAESTNPGEFDQRLWESSRKIDFYLTDISEWSVSKRAQGFSRLTNQIKEGANKILYDVFPQEQAAILQAMIIGEKSELDTETKNQFQAAGISHIIAISGLHMSLIGMGIWTVCKWIGLPMSLAIVSSVSVLASYGILLGNPTTAFRALLMFGILMGAKLFGRSYDLLSALAAAGIVLLLDNPDLLENSGFQLSFSAVLGMGWYCPLEEHNFQKTWETTEKWWVALRSGCSLWFFSLPLVLSSFYQASVLGIVINLFVIPLMPFVLGSGLLAIMFGLFGTGLGSIAGIPAYVLLKGYGLLGEFAEDSSFGMWTPGAPKVWQIILYYLVLFGGAYGFRFIEARWGSRTYGKRWLWILTQCGVKVFLLLIISTPWIRPQKMTMLDVGQGDGIVLQCDGNAVLVDGGSSSRKQIGKNVLLPYLKYEGISYLDMILITHSDEDHTNGAIEVLEESQKGWFQVGAVGMPLWMRETDMGHTIQKIAQISNVEIFYLQEGDAIMFGDTELHILYPGEEDYSEDTNAGSLVFTWNTKWGKGLFTGDLPEEKEDEIMKDLEHCTFLKVGHHGSDYSTTEDFLKVIRPQIALISCGRQNRYGHPGVRLLERLEKFRCEIYRTDLQGALTIDLDKGILETSVCENE